MATYDPEAVRSRPAAPKVSPVDALLDGENKIDNNAFDAELHNGHRFVAFFGRADKRLSRHRRQRPL